MSTISRTVKPLYIVRTNYNRPQDEAFLPDWVLGDAALRKARVGLEEADEFFEGYIGHAQNFHERDGKELGKKIQEHRPGKPIVPCVEFALEGILFHSDIGGMHMIAPYDVGYDEFKERLLLQDPEMEQWTRRLPPGTQYFDLILDYGINLGQSTEIIDRLKADPEFAVQEIEIRRKPFT